VSAPLLPIALAFALGAGLGLVVEAPVWLGPVGLATAALLLVTGRGRSLAGASTGVVLLCILAGWARAALPDPLPAVRGVGPGPVVLEGLVGGAPEVEGPRMRFPLVLRAAGAEPARPASGTLSLSLYGPAPPLGPGDHIRVTGELRALTPFRNPGAGPPGARPRTPRYVVTARAAGVERLPPAPLPWWLRARLGIHAVIEAHLPPVSGALLEGLLIGERRQLPPSLLADFRRAGVYHVLAISGFNVALVAGSAFLLFRLARLPAPLAAGLALATLVAFAAVVGGQASVLRATVMGGLFLAASLLGRESRVWNSLAAALLVLLALDPGSLAEPGLQLSFAATAGLLHLGPWIRGWLAPWCPGPVAAALSVSAGAQLGVTPVMLLHFGQLSPLGVAANLLVVPLAGLLTTGGVLTLAVATASESLAHPLFQSLWLLLVLLRLVVRAVAALPGAIVHVPPPPALAVAAAGLALLLLPWVRGRWAALGVAVLAVGAGASATAAAWPEGLVRVVVLDVGQGEAILVQAPDGPALLVDTGGGGPGRGDRGERVVVPVLRRLGLRRLTAVALTEGAPDHAGGLTGILEGMPIDEVWMPAGSEGAPWLEPAVARGIPRRALARGDRLWIGSLLVTVLHPPRAEPAEGPGPGGPSRQAPLLLRVEWGLFAAVLATGSGPAAETPALRAGLPLDATVLKVSGNGSRRGSAPEFLAAVGPRLAVIPVGTRNPFGHPAPEVLARLGAAGAAVYRTDQDGAVDIRSDGARVWVRAWGRPGPPVEIRLRDGP
jgi:competence protein ComEC